MRHAPPAYFNLPTLPTSRYLLLRRSERLQGLEDGGFAGAHRARQTLLPPKPALISFTPTMVYLCLLLFFFFVFFSYGVVRYQLVAENSGAREHRGKMGSPAAQIK